MKGGAKRLPSLILSGTPAAEHASAAAISMPWSALSQRLFALHIKCKNTQKLTFIKAEYLEPVVAVIFSSQKMDL